MIPSEIIGQLGQLEMSSRPYSLPPAAFCWSEVPANRILTCLAVLLFLFNIRNIFSLFPHMIYSLRSARGQVDLEYNVSVSRLRNHIALVFFLPFCLLADRFNLFPADFDRRVPLLRRVRRRGSQQPGGGGQLLRYVLHGNGPGRIPLPYLRNAGSLPAAGRGHCGCQQLCR